MVMQKDALFRLRRFRKLKQDVCVYSVSLRRRVWHDLEL